MLLVDRVVSTYIINWLVTTATYDGREFPVYCCDKYLVSRFKKVVGYLSVVPKSPFSFGYADSLYCSYPGQCLIESEECRDIIITRVDKVFTRNW